MNAAPHAHIVLAGAVAAHQFHLQVVQRVDVGEAVADGSLQRGIAGQALLLAGDQRKRLHGALPFGFDRRECLLRNRGAGPSCLVDERCCGVFDNIDEIILEIKGDELMTRYKQVAGFAMRALNAALFRIAPGLWVVAGSEIGTGLGYFGRKGKG